MSENLKTQIQNAMKDAMRAKDKPRLGVIRLIMAAIKQREVDERIELTDEDVLLAMDKMLKQRRESIAQFTAAGRNELADIEIAEIKTIQGFMPEPLAEAEILALLQAAIAQTGASGMKDMGKVMAILKPKLQGRADMSEVSRLIKSQLS